MDLYQNSIDVILQNQTKFGSFIASPAFDTYHFSWIRDGSFIAYSLDVAGRHLEAEQFCDWVDGVLQRYACKIETIVEKLEKGDRLEKSDFLNARYTLEGRDEKDEGWGNFQLDAYGTWLWMLAQHFHFTGNAHFIQKYSHSIALTVRYIQSLWHYPNYDIWEENGDKIHASTLACLYGGLNAISPYWEDGSVSITANAIKSYILTNCVVDGHFVKYVGSTDVDASLLWLAVPFGAVNINDPDFIKTVQMIEEKLYMEGGVHRYAKDTYYGGGEWVLLSCWLGWYYVLAEQSEKAHAILQWVEDKTDKDGNLPEQVFTHMLDSRYYEEWVQRWGNPASPLLWSHAMYIVLRSTIDKSFHE